MSFAPFTRVLDGVTEYIDIDQIAAFEADGSGGSFVYLVNNDNPLNVTTTAPNILLALGPALPFATLTRPNAASVYVRADRMQTCRANPADATQSYLFALGRTQPIVIDDTAANVTTALNLTQAIYGDASATPKLVGVASVSDAGVISSDQPIGFLDIAAFTPGTGDYALSIDAAYDNPNTNYRFAAVLAGATTGQINVEQVSATAATVHTRDSAGVAADLAFTVYVFTVA